MWKWPKNRKMIVIGGILLLSVIIAFQFLDPFASVSVRRNLVDIGDDDAFLWQMLYRNAPDDELKAAIIVSGKHPDAIDYMGESLLSKTVSSNRRELAVWLLDKGADPDTAYPGTAPMMYAINRGDVDFVKLLLHYGADPNLDMGGGMTPMSLAEAYGNGEIIKELRRVSAVPSSQRE